MADKQKTGDYIRNIIQIISENLENLEKERVKYGRFKKFLTGINKTILQRQADLEYYSDLLIKYKEKGLAI